MHNGLEKIQNKFLESIGRLTDDFGLNPSVFKLYGYLYLSNKPLSLDEITQALRVSKGSVSMNIRELENWGAVRKIWVRGSRRDFYEAELDIKKLSISKLKAAIQKRISELSSVINELNSAILSMDGLSKEEKEIAMCYKERLKKIGELRVLASKGLSLAEKFCN